MKNKQQRAFVLLNL